MAKHLLRFNIKENATMRLFCFPYAGGAAATFRPWDVLLPTSIELVAVEYPGRVQLKDKPASTMDELIDVIQAEATALLDKPFAFFGHSYGSIVAFALARRFKEQGLKTPVHLFVSARRPPHVQSTLPPLGNLSDDAFLDGIQKTFGAIPPVLLENEDLLKLFLPALRGDIILNEEYLAQKDPPLTVPVTTFFGTEDLSGSCYSLDRWQENTTGAFALKSFSGGHFYIDTARKALVDEIVKTLVLLDNL